MAELKTKRGIEIMRLERDSTGGSCDVSYWGFGKGRVVFKNIVIREKPGQLPVAAFPPNLMPLPTHLKTYVLNYVLRHYYSLATRGSRSTGRAVHRRRRG